MAASICPKIDLSNFITCSLEKRDEFFGLSCAELEQFLLDENLVVKTEQEAFDALQQWVMHSPTERLAEVPKLLPLIRLNQLELHYLRSTVNDLAAQAKCVRLIDSAIRRHFLRLDERERLPVTFQTKPRKSATEVVMCAFVNKAVAKYSTKSKKWTSEGTDLQTVFCSLPTRCMYGKHEMLFYDDYDGFQLLNLITLNVRQLPQLPDDIELSEFAAHIVNDNLYVIGHSDPDPDSTRYMFSQSGLTDSIVQNEMLKYSFASGKWSHLDMIFPEPVTFSIVGHCSAVLNGRIHMASGRPTNLPVKYFTCSELECYDPTEDGWASLAPMCGFRYNAEMVAFKHFLYVFGGLGKLNNVLTTIERYDSIKDEWSVIAKLKDYVYGFGLISVMDRVYLLGGECTKRSDCSWEKYPDDCENNKSYAVFDLNTETVSSHHQKIRKMPRNVIWPSVGYYVNE